MVELSSLAKRLATKGTVVSVDVGAWSGLLPARREWGDGGIRVLPEDALSAFREAREKIVGGLKSFSIPCSDGNFVPDAALDGWVSSHKICCDIFNQVKSMIIGVRPGILETARSAGSARFCECWATQHPSEPIPPPSGILHSSNLAASLVPSEEDMADQFFISTRACQHSLLFMASDPRYSFVTDGERRMSSWLVVDQLIAGNARRLASAMESAIPLGNNWSVRQTRKILEASVVFSRTDLMPELGLSAATGLVIIELDRKPIEVIDGDKLASIVNATIGRARTLSSVSGVLGEIK